MGNTNMELDLRLNKVERMLENYKSTIEPKSGDFIGQHWYDTSTEVLNVWNGRAFTPAYGNSIISTIEGYETRIAQTEYAIQFEVVAKDEVLSAINLSAEGVRIQGSKIRLDGNVEVDGTFTIASLGGNLDNVPDGTTYKKTTANEKTGAGRGYSAINSSNRYQQWLSSADMVSYSLPTTGIVMGSQGIIGRYAGATTFEINATTGSAYFKGAISAESGYIKGELVMNSTGNIKSSNYDEDTGHGWKINNSGLYMGIDSEIYMRPGSSIYIGYGGSGPKLELTGNRISFLDAPTATETWLYSDYYGDLILGDNNLTPNNNLSQDLGSSSYSWDRVYSAYYNFKNTGAYFTIGGTSGNYIPIFFNGTTNYTSLFVYQTSTAMATPNRKLRVNVNGIEYWLYAERI